MTILILLFPFLGFLSGSFQGRYNIKGSGYLTTLCTFFSFLISLSLLISITKNGITYTFIGEKWIHIDSLVLNWSLYVDSITSIMLVVVTFISTLVHLYSTEYMEFDPHFSRFMSYLSLFTFFMLILITGNNYLQMFVGWEGVGVSSYLLINFWFTRIQANKSAIKAMLVNRVGDFALLLALFSLIFIFNTLDYEIIFSIAPYILNYKISIGNFNFFLIDIICIFLFIGAMGKSAQLGLHTWLPDAMEGPTPVSALIHAATMVTAGVFLLARSSYLLEFSSITLNFIVIVGSLTAFFASTTGLFQNDLKKVIAYSTCSQLGYMIFACGLSSYDVGLFHLSNHAFFKALLFLGAGSVIHALNDEQDMRKMGGLRRILPYSYGIMLIGSLALIGFPFLAGFYSKDIILEISFAKYNIVGQLSYILGSLAAFCTSFYSTRLLYLTFLSLTNGNKQIIFNAHEGSLRMTLPLFFLSILSVTIGYLSKDLFIGFGTDFWNSSIFILPKNYNLTDIEFINLFYKLLPLVLVLTGGGGAYLLYSNFMNSLFIMKLTPNIYNFYTFFNKKWYFDRIINEFLNQKALVFFLNFTYQIIDRGLLEKVGPLNIVNIIKYFYKKIRGIQTGFILQYIIYIISFIAIAIFFFLNFYN